jgi:phytoene synthase
MSPSPVELSQAYAECRRIAAQHGRTYYLATRLLPAAQRPAIHALYAYARTVDDSVDLPAAGPSAPIMAAVRDTAARYHIPDEYFRAFGRSMRMDVPGTAEYRDRYSSMAQLREYMYGSAAVIGLQLLPVLGTVGPRAAAEPAAAALGEAFQLTNFLRDVGEDLDRGRIYLPADELAAFGVDEALLRHCRATGAADARVRRAMAHLIAVNRAIYRAARPGIALLAPRARPAIELAYTLYGEILDRIEEADYAVFDRRVAVPAGRRLGVAAAVAVRAGALRWDRPPRAAAPRGRGVRAAPRPACPEGCRPR